MFVFKLKSPLVALPLALLALFLIGLALFRVDTDWAVRQEVVISGEWGNGPSEFGRGVGADGRPRGPQAIAADAVGNLVVVDSLNYRAKVYARSGELLETFPLPAGVTPSNTEDERASIYGRLVPCLSWGAGFRPLPDLAAPARPWAEPVTAEGTETQTMGLPYITDVDLSAGAWTVDAASGRVDPAAGPEIYFLAGWEGVVLTTDITGQLKWTRDLSTSSRFPELKDPHEPDAPPTPASWAGYMLDLDTLPGGGLVVAGYELLTDRLVFFVRALPEAEGEPLDLAAYELVRDGTVKVDEALPVALEVESVSTGQDGLLYFVAAPPPPPAGGAEVSPFTREVWVFTPDGRSKGKLELDCTGYTRYLRVVGIDKRGLLFARLGGGGSDKPGSVAIFRGSGPAVQTFPLPEGMEIADAYLATDGCLYVSQADENSFQVVRYALSGRGRLVPRWSKGE